MWEHCPGISPSSTEGARVQPMISPHLGTEWGPLWSQKEPAGVSPTFCSLLAPIIKSSLQLLPEATCQYISRPNFCSCHPRDAPRITYLGQPMELCIYDSYGNILKKKAVIKWAHKHFLQLVSPGSMQREQARMASYQFLPERGLPASFHGRCLGTRLLIRLHI